MGKSEHFFICRKTGVEIKSQKRKRQRSGPPPGLTCGVHFRKQRPWREKKPKINKEEETSTRAGIETRSQTIDARGSHEFFKGIGEQ